MLSALTRKCGISAFYTIYQDFAAHELQLSLTQPGTAGFIYGAVAISAGAIITLTHAFGLNYNKILALTFSALFMGVAILLVSISGTEVFM